MLLTREAMVDMAVSEIDNTASLVDTLGLDSIQIVELISGLEEEFDVALEDEELSWDLFENGRSFLFSGHGQGARDRFRP